MGLSSMAKSVISRSGVGEWRGWRPRGGELGTRGVLRNDLIRKGYERLISLITNHAPRLQLYVSRVSGKV